MRVKIFANKDSFFTRPLILRIINSFPKNTSFYIHYETLSLNRKLKSIAVLYLFSPFFQFIKIFFKNNKTKSFSKKIIKENDKIFAYDHFIYLLLNKEMPSNIIHPSIFARLAIYKNIPNVESTGSEELNKIIENKPRWIILRSDFFIKQSPLPEDFMENVKEKYYLFSKIQGQYNQSIFKRK